MRILVVDDEPEMAALLTRGLTAEGHDVVETLEGIAAMGAVTTSTIDLAVVDVSLPGMSGFELSRRIKEHDPNIAVILLTAREALDDRVRGLDAGADDYMIKPFAFAELTARIRAVRRRDALTAPRHIRLGGLSIDLVRQRAAVDGRGIALSRTELDLLCLLAQTPGSVVPRATILEVVWGTSEHVDPNIVDQYISHLRRKIPPEAGLRILTARGAGFSVETAIGA